VRRKKAQQALDSVEHQKLLDDNSAKLETIGEDELQSVEKSSASSGIALLDSKTGNPVVTPKRRVTIVDYYTNGAGDLSSTVGKCFFLAVVLF